MEKMPGLVYVAGATGWMRAILGVALVSALELQLHAQDSPVPFAEPPPIIETAQPPNAAGVPVDTQQTVNTDPQPVAQPSALADGSENASLALQYPLGYQPLVSPDLRAGNMLTFVTDRTAAAFDRTGTSLSLGLSPFGSLVPVPVPTSGTGPLAFKGSIGIGVSAEESGQRSGSEQGWETNSQLSGSIAAVIGHPLTGRFLELQYAGSLQVGGEKQSDGTLNQAMLLTGHCDFSKLKLLLTADYSHSTGPDRDVGSAVDRDLVSASLRADYALSLKTGLSLDLNGSSSFYQTGINSDEMRAALSINRRLSQKTTIGLGATVGALSADQGDDQVFEQANLTLSYVPSVKLTLATMAGYEWRQVAGIVSATPVFNGSVSFAARPTTTFSLSAARSVSNSAAQAQTNYASTTIQASVSQKIGLRLNASLALGYQNASYDSVGGSSEAGGREDNFFFARPSLNVRVSDAFGVSLSYSYGDNRSNERAFQTQTVNLSGTFTF